MTARVRICNVCFVPTPGVWSGRCTNGRCSDCHAKHCTEGGATTPGHGFGKIGGPLKVAMSEDDIEAERAYRLERAR